MKEKETTPARNTPVRIVEGEMVYIGTYTGRTYKDGGFEIYYKNICGDACWANSLKVKTEKVGK